MSAWMIGITNRFAAAVVTAPVINYISHFLTHDLYGSCVGRFLAKLPWEDPDAHWANSPLSLVAILGLGLGDLVSGAIFAGIIFARPGLGSLIAHAVSARNYPVVQAGSLVLVVFSSCRTPRRT